MILASTTESVPYTPLWMCEEDGTTPKPGRPIFRLRAGSVIERAQMEAELAGTYRAGLVGPFELRDAVRNGLMKLLAGDPQLDHLLSLIDVETLGEQDSLPDADKRLLAEARKVLAEHWRDYGDLLAQAERRRNIAPIVALRRFCTGIEFNGEPADEFAGVEFVRDRYGFVADTTLAPFDQLALAVTGARAFNLQYPGTDNATSAEKNSPPPSSSDGDQPTSKPVSVSKAAGSSVKKSGRKTRAS